MVVKHLIEIAKKHKLLIAIFFMMGLVISFLQNFAPRYFQNVVDGFTDGTLTTVHIAVYGAALIALYVISYAYNYPWYKLEQNIGLALKLAALRKVSVIDYLSYTKLGTGTLIQRIENGAAAGRDIFFGFFLQIASNFLPSMLFSIFFVFTINRTVMLAILFGYIVVFIITNLLLKALYKVKENILVNEEKFNHFLVRGFMEMVVFRVNRRFACEMRKAETASKEIISSTVKMSMVHELFFTIFAILIGFVKVGIIIYGWTTNALTIGQIVALIVLVDNAYQPIAVFNVLFVQYKLDKIAFARYAEFLDAKEDSGLSQDKALSELNGNISFSQISFFYDEREIFNDFNLTIQAHTTTAFVGESGSGKSTAIKLLAGLLKPCSGNITIGGVDLQQINLNNYYEHIAYLPQEASIFDGTLRENLVFDGETDDTTLMTAIEKVGLLDLYSKLEKGFDTPLGERGASLSGGERQQLALARLWFSNAQIIIFDESTSAIDNQTEELIMNNVMELLHGKTVIAIAHRLDSIKSFNNTVQFQNGKVVEP